MKFRPYPKFKVTTQETDAKALHCSYKDFTKSKRLPLNAMKFCWFENAMIGGTEQASPRPPVNVFQVPLRDSQKTKFWATVSMSTFSFPVLSSENIGTTSLKC